MCGALYVYVQHFYHGEICIKFEFFNNYFEFWAIKFAWARIA